MSNATPDAQSGSHPLRNWRVLYAPDIDHGDGLVFRCQAEDIHHAIEQCQNAEPESVIIQAQCDDTARLLPAGEGDFELLEDGSCWIAAANVSVLVSHKNGFVEASLFPRGAEDDDAISIASAGCDSVARELLVGSETEPTEIAYRCSGLSGRHKRLHLRQIADPMWVRFITQAFERFDAAPKGDYLVVVPPGDTDIDPGSAVVTPAPLEPDANGMVLVHYESNRIGAENLQRFVDKVMCAAGRAATSYPTIAKQRLPATSLRIVGTFDLRRPTHLELTDAPTLAAWNPQAVAENTR